MGLTFPILFDEDGSTHDEYNPGYKFTNSVFPQDWIIGVDGTLVYASNKYDPEAMMSVIEIELAKMP